MNDPRQLGIVVFWVLFTAVTIYLGIKYGWKGSFSDLMFDALDKKKKK